MSPWRADPAAGAEARIGAAAPSRWPQHARRMLRRLRPATPSTIFLDATGALAWSPAHDGTPARHPDFASWCAAHPGERATLVLSGHLLHSLLLPAPDTSAPTTDPRRAASERFVLYHGRAAALWPIALAGDATARYACALHAVSLAELGDAAEAHGVKIVAAVPLWAEALRGAAMRSPEFASGADATLLIVESTLVTRLDIAAHRLAGIQQRYLDAPEMTALDGLVDRVGAEIIAGAPVLVAGWGIAGEGRTGAGWRALAALDGRPDEAGWLICAQRRERA